MLILSLCWILIGAGAGALSVAAGWGCANEEWSQRAIWLTTMGIGIAAALSGGWLGNLVFDRYYTTPTALWVSAVSVIVVPQLITRLRRRPQVAPR